MKPMLLVIISGAFMLVVLHDQPASNGKIEQAKTEKPKAKAVIKEDALPKENIIEEFFSNNLLW